MAEQHLENVGPNDMIVATSMLTPPKSVVRLRFLPRTLPLQTFIAMGITATIGFLIATSLFGSSMQSLTYGLVLGGGAGYVLSRMSPLEGEGMFTWIGLHAQSAAVKKVTVDGVRCARYIGFAPLHWTANGDVRIRPGCVNVRATGWDDRGYPEWGAEENKDGEERSTDILKRQMAGRQANLLRPGAGMSLSDILNQQEEAREQQKSKIHKQLPSNRSAKAPGKKQLPKKKAPQGPKLRPTAGTSRPAVQPAPQQEEPKKGKWGAKKDKAESLNKKRPSPKKEKKPKKAKTPAMKKPGKAKKSKQKAPSGNPLKPTAGRISSPK